MALTREAKRDIEGPRLTDKSLSPESHRVRRICFVVRDHGLSGRHTAAHSEPMMFILFLFGINSEVENSSK